MWWNSDRRDSPRSFAGLKQINPNNSAFAFKFNELAAYPGHVVRFHFTKRR